MWTFGRGSQNPKRLLFLFVLYFAKYKIKVKNVMPLQPHPDNGYVIEVHGLESLHRALQEPFSYIV